MSNIIEPNFNGLPKPTDWKKVIVPLQQANEKEFRGATLNELGDEMLKDKTINGQRMKAVPPGPLPAGPENQEMYMELLSEGTWTWNGVPVVTNTIGSISNVWWNKVTWSKDDSTELPTIDVEAVITENKFNYKTDFITGKYVNTTSGNLSTTGNQAKTIKIQLPAGTYVLNKAANSTFSAHRIEKLDGTKIETGNPINLNNSAYPKGSGGKGYLITSDVDFIFYTNAELSTQSAVNWLDLRTVQIEPGNKVTDFKPHEYLKSVKGYDIWLPSMAALICRWYGKSGICAGDSITFGADFGSYVSFVANITGAFIQNVGSSGARTGRLSAILTDIKERKDTAVDYVTPNYLDFNFISIMIGTNTDIVGTIASLPALPVNGINPMTDAALSDAQKLDYLRTFPTTYIGNLALILEFVLWKNPKIEIFMISPIQNNVTAGNTVNGTTVSEKPDPHQYLEALKELQKIYDFKLINATDESGITKRNMMRYSYDGVHLNTTGVARLGEYIGNKIFNS